MHENALKAASETLARAFMNDPIQIYALPDTEERKNKSPDHFAAILQYGLMFGDVYASENAGGAVVWLRPGETKITPEQAQQGGLGKLTQILGQEASDRFFAVFDFLEPYHRKDATEPHWYTWVVGVDPALQGTGLGRALLTPVMDIARSNKTPVYLETAGLSTIPFYIKLGFRMVRELTDPTSKLKLWTFRKDH
jgi:ribosomal protein S18 acetylase RimI-like enzyme